jgi:site-specific recombinase
MTTLMAISEAVKTDIALIGIFGVVFPGLVTGLIVFAVAQAMAEHSQNLERRSGRDD